MQAPPNRQSTKRGPQRATQPTAPPGGTTRRRPTTQTSTEAKPTSNNTSNQASLFSRVTCQIACWTRTNHACTLWMYSSESPSKPNPNGTPEDDWDAPCAVPVDHCNPKHNAQKCLNHRIPNTTIGNPCSPVQSSRGHRSTNAHRARSSTRQRPRTSATQINLMKSHEPIQMSAIGISPLGFTMLHQAISSPTRPHSMPQNAHVERNFVQIKHIKRIEWTLPDKGLPKMPTTTQQPSVQRCAKYRSDYRGPRATPTAQPFSSDPKCQPSEWHSTATARSQGLAMRKRLEATDTADQIRDKSDQFMALLTQPYATLLMANMRTLSRNREKPMPTQAIDRSTLMQEVMRRTSRSTIFLGPHPNTNPKMVHDFCTATSNNWDKLSAMTRLLPSTPILVGFSLRPTRSDHKDQRSTHWRKACGEHQSTVINIHPRYPSEGLT